MHYVTLSFSEYPHAYLFFALRWLSSLVCIAFSLQFLRTGKGIWWIIVAAAFALPLAAEVLISLRHGLPPLPYGTVTHQDTWPWNVVTTPKNLTPSAAIPPLMALALAWAWLAEKRRAGIN